MVVNIYTFNNKTLEFRRVCLKNRGFQEKPGVLVSWPPPTAAQMCFFWLNFLLHRDRIHPDVPRPGIAIAKQTAAYQSL